MYIDTHAHLDFRQFSRDREEVIERAREAGVEKIMNVGVNFEASEQSIEFAEKYDFMYATCGVHPSDARDLLEGGLVSEKRMDRLKELAVSHPKVAAIGEIGLDFYRNHYSKNIQEEIFRRQLRLALDLDKPVIIHCRDAYEEIMSILTEEGNSRVVFHCFSGNLEFARKCWRRGFMTSFTGIVTYPKAHALHEVVREVPLPMFMLETDCPFLSPQSKRGQRNEPSFVSEIARAIAEMKGISVKEVQQTAYENSVRFFMI